MNRYILWGVFLAGGVGATAMTQAAELRLIAPGGSTTIGLEGEIPIEVLLDNVFPDKLRAYQATIRIVPGAGATGSMGLADPDSPSNTNQSIRVDKSRLDWVLYGSLGGDFAAVKVPEMQIAATLISASDSVTVTTPKYLGEYVLKASPDALGDFFIQFVLVDPTNPQALPTQLRDNIGALIPFTTAPNGGLRVSVVPVLTNDDCAQATPLFDGVTSFRTENATTDGPSHPLSGCDQNGTTTIWNDVWFDYTASCSGILVTSTCGDASFDTRVAVYSTCACPASDAELIDCNDNALGCAGNTSEAIADGVVAGNCYKIRAGATGDLVGIGDLTTQCIGNDTCQAATSMVVGAGVSGNTQYVNADDAIGPECGLGLPDSPGMWYTVPGTGRLMNATLTGATHDSRLTVYQGGCGSLTCVDDADNIGGSGEIASWCSSTGTTYHILVHGSGGDSGPFTLTVGDQSCSDSNMCTNDTCVVDACVNTPNYDTTSLCCTPSTRDLVPITDGNPCTSDSCNAFTGQVTHTPVADGPNVGCDDANRCTVDTCASGQCTSVDINVLSCTVDGDCPGEDSTCQAGFCECFPATLELIADPGTPPTQGCYAVGDLLTVRVLLGPEGAADLTPADIVGAQFFLEYDATKLDFISIDPGVTTDPSSPFSVEVNEGIDEILGTIDYLVGAGLESGTRDPATVAIIVFQAVFPCDAPILYRPAGPNGEANAVVLVGGAQADAKLMDLPLLRVTDLAPAIVGCPSDVVVGFDPGGFTAQVSWASPVASDTCEPNVPVTCNPSSGSAFGEGTTTVTCDAVNSCGQSAACAFNVTVEAANLVADIELSPMMDSGPFTRCMEFEVWDCDGPPGGEFAVFSENVTFTNGQALGLTLALPGGAWECLTVRDPLHTLRSAAPDFSTLDGVNFTASAMGSWATGGHWLLGGNINGDDFIDIFDFAVFFPMYLTPASRDSMCGTAMPDGNISGDLVIDLLDLVFVSGNSLKASQGACCAGGAAAVAAPRSAASLQELARLGYGDLTSYDIDRNGIFDFADVSALMNGAAPVLDPPGSIRDVRKDKRHRVRRGR